MADPVETLKAAKRLLVQGRRNLATALANDTTTTAQAMKDFVATQEAIDAIDRAILDEGGARRG
jgi:hypothetical protein